MKQMLLALFCAGSASLALAQVQPSAQANGPITALERLDSLKNMQATGSEQRRRFQIQTWQTAKGMRVYFVRAPELPMLDLRLVFDAGSARDADKPGLASITSRMLDEGTLSRDTTQIAAAFEGLGAEFGHASYRDMAVAELRVLTDPEFLRPALEVFADVVARPAFPAASYARIYQSAQIGQQQQKQSPATQASLLFYKNLYGDHPYATPTTGTPESIKRISAADLKAFHQRFYVAGNAVLALVGDIDEAQARALSEQLSGAMVAGAPAPALPLVKALSKGRHVHLDFAASQTHVILGAPGIARGNQDYYALYVGNDILGGGGFGSLLTRELREKRGLTYGVSSGFTPMRVQGPFAISFSTQTERASEALQLSRAVLRDFIQQGPSAAQVQDSIANIVGGYPLGSASNAAIVGTLGMIGFYGLPLDYMDSFLDKIQAVTAADIRAAFARHVNPDRQLLITVGQQAPQDGGKQTAGK